MDGSAERVIDDVTECSICTEAFSDPRVLPCIHTFCLKCLLEYGKDKRPGATMSCPLCRKAFTVPVNGLAGMQNNFFMEKLIHARKQPSGKETQHIYCDACSRDEASASRKSAKMHCGQCQQNYCDQCSRKHAVLRKTADHVQTDIEQTVPKVSAGNCEIHKDKEMQAFCQKCKLPVCVMCVLESHKDHHECVVDIEQVSGSLHSEIQIDTDKVTERLEKIKQLLSRFEKDKNNLAKHLADVVSDINKTSDQLISDIQCQRRQLLSEVESIRINRCTQLEKAKNEVEQHMAALESFKRQTETLLSSGTAGDVIRSAKSLHDTADELVKFDVTGYGRNSLVRVAVKFISSTVLHRNIGDIVEEKKGVSHIIPGGSHVNGAASLGDDVFLVHTNSQHIEVYDAVTSTFRRSLPIPEFGLQPGSLVVCAINKCLYVSDFNNDSVHRVDLPDGSAVMKWSVASSPVGLSVNSAQNVLVVCTGVRKLQEFTTGGSLVRDIELRPGIEYPRHAVQLPTGEFLVSHCGLLHRVCIVNDQGAVVRSYGGPPGSGSMQMNQPEGLAVDKHGNVLVADHGNNRLLVLDQSLRSAREIPASGDEHPYSVCYDESRRRLCVGVSHKVLVTDNVKDFGTGPV